METIDTAPRDGTHILAYGFDPRAPNVMLFREVWWSWNIAYRYTEVGDNLYSRQEIKTFERWEPDREFVPVYWMERPDTSGVEDAPDKLLVRQAKAR